jgi:predicted lipoprotein with Yx(FWY)xxD motif
MLIAAATFAFAGSLAAIAFAGGTAVTVGSASNAALGEQVLVNSQGRTLYVLSPETSKHLLCKSSECLKFWPPLTVRSSKTKLEAGAGVHGHLGILHRSNGMLQVTLNGRPLYRFSEDHAGGEVNGQNFKSFGGTWHVVNASGSPSSTTPAAASTPTSTTTNTTPTTSTPTTSTPTTSTPTTSTPTTTTPTTTTPTTTNPYPPGWE